MSRLNIDEDPVNADWIKRVHRSLGGPGSGHFGHAGRPGQVGGSAPAESEETRSEKTSAVESSQEPQQATFKTETPKSTRTGATMSHKAFTERLEAKGYKTLTRGDLDHVYEDWEAEGTKLLDTQTPIHESTLMGVERALEDLEREAPGLHELLKDQVYIVPVDYDQTAVATAVSDRTGTYILINTTRQDVEKSSTFTIAQKRIDPKLSPEERAVETFRGVLVHEAGHVADFATGGKLTAAIVGTLMDRLPPPPHKTLPAFVKENISEYASFGGPQETTAELFTAAILNFPVGRETDELNGVLDKIRAINRKKAS